MRLGSALSKKGVEIHLNEERFYHITFSHKEIELGDFPKLLGAIKDPDFILEGDSGELLAVKKKPRKRKWFVVVYKEENMHDGFIITAYLTSNIHWLLKRKAVWSKQS